MMVALVEMAATMGAKGGPHVLGADVRAVMILVDFRSMASKGRSNGICEVDNRLKRFFSEVSYLLATSLCTLLVCFHFDTDLKFL